MLQARLVVIRCFKGSRPTTHEALRCAKCLRFRQLGGRSGLVAPIIPCTLARSCTAVQLRPATDPLKLCARSLDHLTCGRHLYLLTRSPSCHISLALVGLLRASAVPGGIVSLVLSRHRQGHWENHHASLTKSGSEALDALSCSNPTLVNTNDDSTGLVIIVNKPSTATKRLIRQPHYVNSR